MRILLTAQQPYGGIRTFFRYVYSQKEFSDCEFDLIAPEAGMTEYFNKFMPEKRIRVIPQKSKNVLLNIVQISKIIRQENYDLVHSHGFTAAVISSFACVGRSVPHLMTGHDVFSENLFKGIKGKAKKALLTFTFKRLDGIHTVSEYARNNFMQHFEAIEANKIACILHGIDTEMFYNGTADDIRTKLNIDQSTPIIGFFGRFMALKGFVDLVHAIKLIIDNKMMWPYPKVVTYGWGGFIREDYAYIERLGLKQYFVQLPTTDNMPSAMKAVDVIAMPSRSEACGLLAMEALTAGVPIVGTNCTGLTEVLKGSPAGIVNPRDPKGLAIALVEIIKKKSKIEFIDYQQIACKRFSVQNTANQLHKLYIKLINR